MMTLHDFMKTRRQIREDLELEDSPYVKASVVKEDEVTANLRIKIEILEDKNRRLDELLEEKSAMLKSTINDLLEQKSKTDKLHRQLDTHKYNKQFQDAYYK